jgi:hypothetical protein
LLKKNTGIPTSEKHPGNSHTTKEIPEIPSSGKNPGNSHSVKKSGNSLMETKSGNSHIRKNPEFPHRGTKHIGEKNRKFPHRRKKTQEFPVKNPENSLVGERTQEFYHRVKTREFPH